MFKKPVVLVGLLFHATNALDILRNIAANILCQDLALFDPGSRAHQMEIYRDIGQLINIANPEQNINFLRSCHEGLSPKRRLSFAWGFQGLSEQYPKNYPRSWTRKLLILTVDLSIVSPWMIDPWQIDPYNWGPYNSYGVHNWDSSQYWYFPSLYQEHDNDYLWGNMGFRIVSKSCRISIWSPWLMMSSCLPAKK